MAKTNITIRQIEAFFWRELLHQPWLLLGSFLIIPATILRTVVSPLFIARAFASLARKQPVDSNLLYGAAAALVIGILLEHFSSVCETEMNIRNGERLYQRCFNWLIKQDYAFYTNEFIGSLVAQSNRFVKACELHTFLIFMQALGMLSSVVAALAIMTFYSAAIGLVSALVWGASIFLAGYMTVKRIPVRRRAVAADSLQTGALADALTNAVTIKTFANEELEAERYLDGNVNRANRYRESWALALRNGTVVRILAAILQMTVFVGGVIAIQDGVISLAVFLLFQVYVLIMINSISESQLLVRNLEGVYGDADEMMQLFAREPNVKDPVSPKPCRIKDGGIKFDKVSFRYSEHAKNDDLFRNFNLEISPGEKVGLVGPSGGGKTTVTKLLLRFMDIDAGTIAIDGQDIRQLSQADLHQVISYVPQEPLLFHRSLKENIAYAKPGASQQEIESAASKAHAHEFIKGLPLGYKTLVGERGIKLSGGQRQRIALARTILKSAPVLILDEPTSALDSESEAYVQEALWQLMEGKTTVVIAHRLSTIMHMDRIIVLDRGTILEQGTHSELIAKKGAYAKLWSHQSDGFIR